MVGIDKEEHEGLNSSFARKTCVETNVIINGDCKEKLKMYKDNTIDLIYVDPPFFSNQSYEILWGNGFELKAYEDRWKGGIQHYIEWMKPALEQCYRVLKETGTMYLHCDWHANSYLRVLMDEIFGRSNFKNEIIWCYTGPSRNVKDFPDKHDTIFRYVKGGKYTFNIDTVRVPYSESFLQRREYSEGRAGIFKGFGRHRREDFKIGKLMEDWWVDIPAGGQIPRTELLGYPTQKPVALLKRIIEVSSNPTDIVLDPMVGGGTTVAVAHKLGRRWIGIDVSPLACKLTARRLRKIGATSIIIGGPMTKKDVMNLKPFEFQKWVCDKFMARMTKKVGDMGIDGWTMEMIPIQAKQSEGVGRNVIDNFETAIKRKNKIKGIIVAFNFGRGAYEEVARAKQKEGLEIELKTVDELLR